MVLRGQFRRSLDWRPDWRIGDAPLVFADLETTGLFPERGQRITEVAVIDAGGLRCHHTTDNEGFEGAAERRLLHDIFESLENVIVVGHNIGFDLRFLFERAARRDVEMPTIGMIDTLRLAKSHLDAADYRLASVAQYLELELPGSLHRAKEDTRLVRDVFWEIVDRGDLQTLADVDIQRLDLCFD